MKTATFNNNAYRAAHSNVKNTGKKFSLKEKLRAYWNKNQKDFICAMFALNGDVNSYRMYQMYSK